MSVRALNRRLAELRRAGQGEEVGKIVVIALDDWPDHARDAYDAACAAGYRLLRPDIIEAQTGDWPVFPDRDAGAVRGLLPPAVIEVRYRER